jgi:predicted DNA-binding protein with PD1-like motif
MEERRIKDGSERTYAVVFGEGEDPLAGLCALARSKELSASRLAGIGGFSRATLGFFDPEARGWHHIPIDEQVEVVSLTGTVALDEGLPSVRVKCVLARRDGSVVAGHLLAAAVRPALELVLTEAPGTLLRCPDPESGLAFIAPGRRAG